MRLFRSALFLSLVASTSLAAADTATRAVAAAAPAVAEAAPVSTPSNAPGATPAQIHWSEQARLDAERADAARRRHNETFLYTDAERAARAESQAMLARQRLRTYLVGLGAVARPPQPAPRPEVQPPAPTDDAYWIAGEWIWEATAWVWYEGYWDWVGYLTSIDGDEATIRNATAVRDHRRRARGHDQPGRFRDHRNGRDDVPSPSRATAIRDHRDHRDSSNSSSSWEPSRNDPPPSKSSSSSSSRSDREETPRWSSSSSSSSNVRDHRDKDDDKRDNDRDERPTIRDHRR